MSYYSARIHNIISKARRQMKFSRKVTGQSKARFSKAWYHSVRQYIKWKSPMLTGSCQWLSPATAPLSNHLPSLPTLPTASSLLPPLPTSFSTAIKVTVVELGHANKWVQQGSFAKYASHLIHMNKWHINLEEKVPPCWFTWQKLLIPVLLGGGPPPRLELICIIIC